MKPKNFQGLCLLLGILAGPAHGSQDMEVAVTLLPSQNIREVAKTYLNDPDLWPDILSANGLPLTHELHPGMSLKIPVRKILAVEQALEEGRRLIHQATQAGARLFVPSEISEAIRQHTAALGKRRQGQWEAALEQSQAAITAARQALKISLANRDVPAEAVLDDAGGKVQRRKPTDLYWKKTVLKTLLAERDRVRTLSDSFALILFRDASRLRLNENAQVLIQKIRRDRLKKRETANVVLYGGDIYALLGASGQRQNVDVQVKGIQTEIRSNNFWMDKTRNKTRLANYDGEIQVSSGGATVRVKENQGTWVKTARRPTDPKDLLAAPELQLPENSTTVYQTGVDLAWTADREAVAYWVEVAKDPAFRRLLVNTQQVKTPAYFLPLPEDGLYYWRVSAIDAAGLPGPKSQARFFKVQRDTQPPYLVILAPQEQAWLREDTVQVRGKSEAQATLSEDGKSVSLGMDGAFHFAYHLQPGENTLVLESRDPAGNITRLTRTVHYMPDTPILVHFADNLPRLAEDLFVVNRPVFTLSGHTHPGVAIKVRSGQASGFETSTFADAEGRFQVNLSVLSDSTDFRLVATLPTGFAVEKRFSVTLDTVPPQIVLDAMLPALTATALLPLSGQVKGGARLYINGSSAQLSDTGRFSERLDLQPGANRLEVIAEDLAGNTAVWQKEILLDQSAPELLGYTLSKDYVRGGGTVQVEVRARDASGMKVGVPFALNVSDYTHRGYLRLCPDRTCYRATVTLPRLARGKTKLVYVKLEDYLGNSREYRFD